VKPHRRKRLAVVAFIAVSLSMATGLTLFALSQNIDLFYTPTQVAGGEVNIGQQIRIGGMVKEGSYESANDTMRVMFSATDYVNEVPIQFDGILPDLFREGQGIVVEGAIDSNGLFVASRVLAKHDENYMSNEVKAAMEAAGVNTENQSALAEY
jgi:cytochrome c-type biogenesis protein CcmE